MDTIERAGWREHRFRVGYVLVSGAFLAMAVKLCRQIVTEDTLFNLVSYAGTVATLIALLITVCEVIHNATISRAIRREAAALLDQVRSLDRATLLAECITAIDDITKLVANARYSESLGAFQSFRKTFSHARTAGLLTADIKLELSDVEMDLALASTTTPVAPLSNPQKHQLHRRLLDLKTALETATTDKK